MTAVLFLDAKNGWARDNVNLFQTRDGGASWGAISKLDGHHRGLTFISQSTGFVVEGDKVIRTDDGGKTWKPAWQCAVDMEVQGLTRKLPCHLRDLSFAGAKLGFAYGELKGAKRAVLAVTDDGGSTWRASSPDMMDSAGMRIYAWGETHALASMYDRKTLLTTDGGKTWVPVVADISGEAALYAMPGGSFGVSAIYHRKIAYTHNGGRSFSTREFPVPAQIGGLSFGDRRSGYIVGEHGMVYRYHVVPAQYSVPNMIAAPVPE